MELFTWPCGCKSPTEGGNVTEPCNDCLEPDETVRPNDPRWDELGLDPSQRIGYPWTTPTEDYMQPLRWTDYDPRHSYGFGPDDRRPSFLILRNEDGRFALTGDSQGTIGTYETLDQAKQGAEDYRTQQQRDRDTAFLGAGI